MSQAHNPDGTIKDGAVTKASVGLGNVDNTSDANKPISDATQTALNAKVDTADLATAVPAAIPNSYPQCVVVATGNEVRPTGSEVVFWVGGSTQPANMGAQDVWFNSNVVPSGDTTAPSTPAGLAASSVTSSSFHLSWNASTDDTGVTGYQVRLNGATVDSPTTTSYDATGLAASTDYTVSVRARDAAGNWSAWSSDLVVATTAAAATSHTVFAASGAPTLAEVGNLTQYSDGPVSPALRVANAFYAAADGWTCTGARVWIPAGADVSGTLTLDAWKTSRTEWPTALGWEAPTQQKSMAAPVAGAWNEIMWDTPIVFDNESTVWIGYHWGGKYLHSPGVDDTNTQASDGALLYLSENPVPGSTGVARAANSAAGSAGHFYYGVDIIAEAP